MGGLFAWETFSRSTQQPIINDHTGSSLGTTSYEKLSDTDRKKIHFKFKANRATDEKAETEFNNGGGLLYNINLQIKNNTDKNVSFDESQFELHGVDESADASSRLSNSITVKTNTSKTIKTMFKHVGDQQVVPGYAYFEYLGKYQLAYVDSKLTAGGSKSTNVDNQKLIDTFNGSSENATGTSNDTTNNFSIVDTKNSGQIVTSSSDAVKIAKNLYDAMDIGKWKLDEASQSAYGGELNSQSGYYILGVTTLPDNDVHIFVTNNGVAEEIE